MSANEDFTLEQHEKIAKDSFNKTWDYLDKKDRSEEDDLNMIHSAHASRYHWGILFAEGKGTALNLQRGEWMLSHVYTILERPEAAFFHAEICLDLTEKNNIEGFDLGFAYEAMARSLALRKNEDACKKYFDLAKKAADKIKNKDDRDYFLGELEGGNWFGLK